MDIELKQQWVKALRGGRYKQGDGALRQYDDGELRYCCLGVLANCITPNRWHQNNNKQEFSFGPFTIYGGRGGRDSHTYLPESLLNKSIQDKLAGMNDNKGLSFLEIADWIEKNI